MSEDIKNTRGKVRSKKKAAKKNIGYGNPPESGQFKPGQSGNPSGRPKQSLNRITIFRQYLMEEIEIPTGEKISRIHFSDRKLWSLTTQGDLKAMKLLNELVQGSPDLHKNDEEAEIHSHPPAKIIKVRTVDARHPMEIALEAAERAGGKFVHDDPEAQKRFEAFHPRRTKARKPNDD